MATCLYCQRDINICINNACLGGKPYGKSNKVEPMFSDSETFMKERPTKITKEQEQNYYREVAQDIIDNNWSDCSIEQIVEDLSTLSVNENGYELAKDLEFDKSASYDIDSQFVEYLDDFGYNKRKLIEKNVETWVKAHNPQPKFSIGQKLIINSSLNYRKKKDMIVYVNGVNEKQAYYLIDEDPNKKGGTIVEYEKVERYCSII